MNPGQQMPQMLSGRAKHFGPHEQDTAVFRVDPQQTAVFAYYAAAALVFKRYFANRQSGRSSILSLR